MISIQVGNNVEGYKEIKTSDDFEKAYCYIETWIAENDSSFTTDYRRQWLDAQGLEHVDYGSHSNFFILKVLHKI